MNKKALSLSQRLWKVEESFHTLFQQRSGGPSLDEPYNYVVAVFDDYAIVYFEDKYWRAGYTIDEDGAVTIDAGADWVEVVSEWVAVKTTATDGNGNLLRLSGNQFFPRSSFLYAPDPLDTLSWKVRIGNDEGRIEPQLFESIKSIFGLKSTQKATEGAREAQGNTAAIELAPDVTSDTLVAPLGGVMKTYIKNGLGYVEALGLRFGNEAERDLYNEYFDAETYFGKSNGDNVDATLNHRQPMVTKSTKAEHVKALVEASRTRFTNAVRAKVTDVGIVASHILDLANEYEKMVFQMAEKGVLRWSSGSASHMVDRDDNGHIKQWPIIEWAYTPTAAEPRLPTIAPVKSLVGVELTMSDNESSAPTIIKKGNNMSDETKVFNDQMQAAFDNLRVKAIDEPLGKMADEQKSLSKAVSDLMTMVQELADRPTKGAERLVTNDGGTKDLEVKSFSDFLMAVKRRDTQRIMKVYNSRPDYDASFNDNTRALSEDSGTSGGYLVPTDFATSLLQVNAQTSPILSRVQIIPVSTRNGEWPSLNQYAAPTAGAGNTAFAGGVTAASTPEAAALTETNPSFDMIKWQVEKIGGYTQVSNELVNDSPMAVEALLTALFNVSVNAKLEYFILRGSGAGVPLGILNAQAALASNTVTNNLFSWADVATMQSRFHQVGTAAPVWLIHPSVWPDILQMEIGTAGASAWVANMQAAQGNSLNGYQILQSEHLPQANNAGDVILADLFAYVLWRRQAISIAFSEHYGFVNDLGTWRFTVRADGKPWLTDKITLADPQGSYTVSPFVYHND